MLRIMMTGIYYMAQTLSWNYNILRICACYSLIHSTLVDVEFYRRHLSPIVIQTSPNPFGVTPTTRL